jgi:hypothetical protein
VNAKLPAAALAKNDRRVDSMVNSFTLPFEQCLG